MRDPLVFGLALIWAGFIASSIALIAYQIVTLKRSIDRKMRHR